MKRDDSARALRELHTKTDREMEKAKQVCSNQPTNPFKCVRLIRPSFVCLNTSLLRMLYFGKRSTSRKFFNQPINFPLLVDLFIL